MLFPVFCIVDLLSRFYISTVINVQKFTLMANLIETRSIVDLLSRFYISTVINVQKFTLMATLIETRREITGRIDKYLVNLKV